MITVLRAGPLTTVQDLGRPGYAHLGVPRSGALDQPALIRANRLIGNAADAAGLETTLMGCRLRFEEAATVAVTGASATLKVDKVEVSGPVVEVPAGAVLEIGRATRGLRSYLAVAGGIAVEPVLGSRSTDTLSGLGPERLSDGMVLPIGAEPGGERADPGEPEPDGGELELDVRLGPRDDWFEVAGLFAQPYRISPMSNRVGARLAGTALTRTKAGELPSEGVVLGAVQVPANGEPIIFLADHPTTGGYPVIGVVEDVTPLAQARPGTTVRFRELD
ncbi:biotin-dependent carboxyltransferase family protein [Actinoplanes sp. NBC_00393]|uniref:5-oxoprolinase subunit C family protein n=1 Tax=Actinoplanes sp. NBC_00393 TaxID=2975953 RepID=UPI002E20B6D1